MTPEITTPETTRGDKTITKATTGMTDKVRNSNLSAATVTGGPNKEALAIGVGLTTILIKTTTTGRKGAALGLIITTTMAGHEVECKADLTVVGPVVTTFEPLTHELSGGTLDDAINFTFSEVAIKFFDEFLLLSFNPHFFRFQTGCDQSSNNTCFFGYTLNKLTNSSNKMYYFILSLLFLLKKSLSFSKSLEPYSRLGWGLRQLSISYLTNLLLHLHKLGVLTYLLKDPAVIVILLKQFL
jgi:hypothetical protein